MFAPMSVWIAGIAALIGMHTCAHDVHEGQQLHAQNLTQLQVNLRWHRWKKQLFCLLFDNKILPVDSRSVEDTLMWNVLCFGQRNRMLACPWALWSPVTIPGSKWPKLAFEERGARVSKVVLYIDLLISMLCYISTHLLVCYMLTYLLAIYQRFETQYVCICVGLLTLWH